MRITATAAIVVSASLLFGCNRGAVATVQGVPAIPEIVQTQGDGPWLSFPLPSNSHGLSPGWDGNMYICSDGNISRVDMQGADTVFVLGPDACFADGVTRNPDGNVYFAEAGNREFGIGQIQPDGTTTFFPDPGGDGGEALTSGSDGNVWMATGTVLVRMTPQGVFTNFRPFSANELQRGTDGDLWTYASQPVNPELLRIALDGTITYIPVPHVWGIVAGSDGGMWFGEGSSMARLDPATMKITTYHIPRPERPFNMVQGRDNTLYFINTKLSPPTLGRYNIKTHKLLSDVTLAGNSFNHLVIGPDGNLWLGEEGRSQVDVYVVDALTTDPTSFALAQGQSAMLTAKEKFFTKPLTAQTSNAAVATVAAEGTDAWSVLGVASGSCTITVSDTKGNSVDLSVTVQ